MYGFFAHFPFILPVPLANAHFGRFLAENFANLIDLTPNFDLLTLRIANLACGGVYYLPFWLFGFSRVAVGQLWSNNLTHKSLESIGKTVTSTRTTRGHPYIYF